MRQFSHKLLSTIAAGCLFFGITTNVFAQTEFKGSLNTVSISDADGINKPPTAIFTYTRDGLFFTFDATDSIDTDGSITEYRWDFGDGSTGIGKIVNHSYPSKENLSVTLTAIDDDQGTTLTQTPLLLAPSEKQILDISAYSGNTQLIASDANCFVGGRYTGNTIYLSRASFLISTWVGVPTTNTRTYEVRVYDMIDNTLGTLKGTSEGVSGNSFDTSISFRDFTFNPPVEVQSGDAIVLTEKNQTVDNRAFVRTYNNNQANPLISFGIWNTSKIKTLLTSTSAPSIRLISYE